MVVPKGQECPNLDTELVCQCANDFVPRPVITYNVADDQL